MILRNKILLAESLAEFGFTHSVTIKPNFTLAVSQERLQSLFSRIYVRVQRRVLGPRFHLPSKRAIQFPAISVVEGLPYSGHLHGAFKVPDQHWATFEAMFDPASPEHQALARLLPGGTWHTEVMDNPKGWFSYTFKQLWKAEHTDRIQMFPMS
jgi:hypothetical protein